MPHNPPAWPTQIRVNKEKTALTVEFDDGRDFTHSAEYLRVMSPSAEVQGHSPDQRKTVGGKRNVKIRAVEPIGNYAVKITFDDGHDTGLYAWSYLYELGADRDERWSQYLEELEQKSLSRG